MLQAIINIFRIPELRNRVFFTCTMIAIYRIGFWIPLAGVNQQQMVEAAAKATEDASGWGKFLDYASIFSGGSFSQSTIFGLGIMPYITASIIFQLLQSVMPNCKNSRGKAHQVKQKLQNGHGTQRLHVFHSSNDVVEIHRSTRVDSPRILESRWTCLSSISLVLLH